MPIDNENVLKAIEEVTSLLCAAYQQIPENVLIIGSRGERKEDRYKLSSSTIYETSINEKLIVRLANNGFSRIGWESSYPEDPYKGCKGGWGRARLEIGVEPVSENSYLFQTAIEVKKVKFVPEMVPYNVWNDVFKLCFYHNDDPKVGINKFVLLFYEGEEISEVNRYVEKAFIKYEYLLDWVRSKNTGGGNDTGELFRFFLSNCLGWQDESEISFIMRRLGIKDASYRQFLIQEGHIRNKDIGCIVLKLEESK